MSFSDYGASEIDSHEGRPDKVLVVECGYEGASRKIRFNSTRTCSYDFLRRRVEECFSLAATAYAITYTDDDGEVTEIASDADLTEAIRYFRPVEDERPLSSTASILSGRSFNKGKVVLRVRIHIDYDGPSLSDTSSLVSMDDYRERNGSELSLSYAPSSPVEMDDDSITVSSKDMGSKYDGFRSRGSGSRRIVSAPSQEPLIERPSEPPDDWAASSVPSISPTLDVDDVQTTHSSRADPFLDPRASEDPSAVFERLRLNEDVAPGSSYGSSTLHSERGAAWLRDQEARILNAMLINRSPTVSSRHSTQSTDPPDSASDAASSGLALQQDPSGKYYYAYTGAGSIAGSQTSHDSGYDEHSGYDPRASTAATLDPMSRPVSMDVYGMDPFASPSDQANLQRSISSVTNASSSSAASSSNPYRRSNSAPRFAYAEDFVHPDVPHDVLPYLTGLPPAPPHDPPHCSECGVVLDTIRYVCSRCGERKSPADDARKGKDRESAPSLAPPRPRSPLQRVPSPSMSAWSVLTGSDVPLRPLASAHSSATAVNTPRSRPLPTPPGSASPGSPPAPSPRPNFLTISAHNGSGSNSGSGSSGSSSAPSPGSPSGNVREGGYELCWVCIESAGVTHGLEMSVAPGASPGPGDWAGTAEDAQRALSRWRRAAPSQKGQLRHAFIEKSWGHKGWQDVEQDEHRAVTCSTCNTLILKHRFKCASCKNFNLCRACYSQVHEIHPSHAFLVVPDTIVRTKSEPALSSGPGPGEQSMTHPGVKCAHCMQDIVGARFHCAICEDVDICANCESAGLPGNIDSSDGGHNTSHIMIKIPYPLPQAELQSASRTAKSLWTDRDAATGQRVPQRARRNSLISSYDGTVLGTANRMGSSATLIDDASAAAFESEDHGLRCGSCNTNIVGVRYQCAHCPSVPRPYSLCSDCERSSYFMHDPMHIFFKIPRPVHRPLQVDHALLPLLYKVPVASMSPLNLDDPTAYLKDLLHRASLCDCCMSHIVGAWYRCAYCGRDLCEVCQEMDAHDRAHVFIVFKAPVDIQVYRRFATDLDDPNRAPVIPFPIYES